MTDNLTTQIRLRVYSAVLLLPLVCLIIFMGFPYYHGLILCASMYSGYEWGRICYHNRFNAYILLFVWLLLIALTLLIFGYYSYVFPFTILCSFMYFLLTNDRKTSFWLAFGNIYLVLGFGSLLWLYDAGALAGEFYGIFLILWLSSLVWLGDIFAYLCGNWIGGLKLVPRISPGKTWAGFLGGILCSLLFTICLIFWLYQVDFLKDIRQALLIVLLSIPVSISGHLGDIMESYFKRCFKVKDSGTIIPGHGGLLDRVDSLLIASPVSCILLSLSGVI